MMDFLGKIVRFFLGTSKDSIGSKIAGGISAVALVAALTPLALWFIGNKDEVFISITYGQLSMILLFFWMLLEIFRTVKDTS